MNRKRPGGFDPGGGYHNPRKFRKGYLHHGRGPRTDDRGQYVEHTEAGQYAEPAQATDVQILYRNSAGPRGGRDSAYYSGHNSQQPRESHRAKGTGLLGDAPEGATPLFEVGHNSPGSDRGARRPHSDHRPSGRGGRRQFSDRPSEKRDDRRQFGGRVDRQDGNDRNRFAPGDRHLDGQAGDGVFQRDDSPQFNSGDRRTFDRRRSYSKREDGGGPPERDEHQFYHDGRPAPSPAGSAERPEASESVASQYQALEGPSTSSFQQYQGGEESRWPPAQAGYVAQLEADKKNLETKVAELQSGITKDGQILSLIKENIEKVKQAQEAEKKNIDGDKQGLLAERKAFELEKAKMITDLQTQKRAFEIEMAEAKRKSEFGNPRPAAAAAALSDRDKFRKLLFEMKELKKENRREKEERAAEEKRHLAAELEELETRREMTQRALESEAKIEELEGRADELGVELSRHKQNVARKETENRKLAAELEQLRGQNDTFEERLGELKKIHSGDVEKLRQERVSMRRSFDAEYAVFLKKKDEFDDTEKIKCVFCPVENLLTIPNFLFHVAREHMFDQYKSADTTDCTVKVAMLLKRLEDKIKMDSSSEIKYLRKCMEDLTDSGNRAETVKEEKNQVIKSLKSKIVALERDIENLLEVESNQKEQLESLVTRNNTLQNQVRTQNTAEILRLENQELQRKLSAQNKEVSVLADRLEAQSREGEFYRGKLKDEVSEKTGWKAKFRDAMVERNNLRKRQVDLEAERDAVKADLRQQISRLNADKTALDQRIRGLEEDKDELIGSNSALEAQIAELQGENDTMKGLRSEANVLQNVAQEELKVENSGLKMKLASAQSEARTLRAELGHVKGQKADLEADGRRLGQVLGGLERELADSRTENQSLHARLAESVERIQVFENEVTQCLSDQKGGFDADFDMGIESILTAPPIIDDLANIDNISIDYLESLEAADGAEDEGPEVLVPQPETSQSKDEVASASESPKGKAKRGRRKSAGAGKADAGEAGAGEEGEVKVRLRRSGRKVGAHPDACDCSNCRNNCDTLARQ